MTRIPFKYWLIFQALFISALDATADDEILVDLNAGVASATESGFDNSILMEVAVAYTTSDFFIRLGYSDFDKFDYDENSVSAYVETDGFFLQGGKIFEFNALNVELGLGLYQISTKSKFEGFSIGTSEDTSPFASVEISKDLSKRFTLHGGYKYIDSVAGTNLSTTFAGLRFRF